MCDPIIAFSSIWMERLKDVPLGEVPAGLLSAWVTSGVTQFKAP